MTIWIPELSGNGPLYRQLVDAITNAVQQGELKEGAKLPPQRQLADALGVTIGTVTRAYTLAEQNGTVIARVGSGTYVRKKEAFHPFGHVFESSADNQLDLSHASPPPNSCREESLARAMYKIQHNPALLKTALDYQSPESEKWHQQVFAEWFGRNGRPVVADELITNQGGMHGIYLSLRVLLGPGDRIAVERMTYPGTISAIQQLSLKSVAIPGDDEGIDIDALDRAFRQQPFRALYLMPDCQNPTTVRMSEERRQALADLARRHQFWIIEDDVYLYGAGTTAFYQLVPERTVTLFSMSKLLGGGLRVGAMRAPRKLHPRLKAALRVQSWMPPSLMTSLTCQWINSGDIEHLLSWQRSELERRYERAMDRLKAYQPKGLKGGFYLWLPLPNDLRASQIVEQLYSQNVIVSSAENFCPGSVAAPQAMRICFSSLRDIEALDHALDIMADTLGNPEPTLWQTI